MAERRICAVTSEHASELPPPSDRVGAVAPAVSKLSLVSFSRFRGFAGHFSAASCSDSTSRVSRRSRIHFSRASRWPVRRGFLTPQAAPRVSRGLGAMLRILMLSAATLCAGLQCGRPLFQQQQHIGPKFAQSRARASPAAASMLTAESIDIDSPTPPGPDPYRLVQDELEHIKRSIKKTLKGHKGESGALTSNGVLTMAAREFMSRRGKSFRPMLVLLIGRATDPDFSTNARHTKLAVISEMIHTASLIHEDVLEEHEDSSEAGTLVHQEIALDVGNKVRASSRPCALPRTRSSRSWPRPSPATALTSSGWPLLFAGVHPRRRLPPLQGRGGALSA